MSWSRYFHRARWHHERAQELQAYLDAETADNLGRGMPPSEARAAAIRKLGNPTSIREEIYRMNTMTLVETLWQDLRYAVRMLRKSPAFAFVAVLSLALGIGANTAVFSVIHAVLLRPLPYPNAGELVRVGRAVSVPEFQHTRDSASSFASVTAERGASDRQLTVAGQRLWISAMTVSADFFRTLGTPLAMGREFNLEETRPTGPRSVILSDSLWRSAFQADAEVLGRTVALDDVAYTVIGVLRRDFWHPQKAEAFVAMRPSGSLSDGGLNTLMTARLKPGVGIRQAEAEMPALAQSLRLANPGFGANYRGLTIIPYRDSLVGDVRLNLLLLFGAVGLLLLIACANLAGLLLARLAVRQKEVAMRFALGSSRGRLIRQFLAENILLTAAGGLAGLLAAGISLDLLVAAIPFQLPSSAPIRLDTPVLAFTFAVALATGLAFSLAPIFTASRLDLHDTLKTGGRSPGSARQRTRSILIVSEVALSVTLLAAAGLLIQSLYRLHREPLGFQPQGLSTFATPFGPEHRRNVADQWRYQSELSERLRLVPGVSQVAAINILPFRGWGNIPTQREGHPENSIGGMEIRYISSSYFEVMGIPMRRGRAFSATDTAASPPVILVNETLARRWWPAGNPVGDRVVIGRYQGRDFGKTTPREVVGVAGDTKTSFLKAQPWPTVYLPAAQMSDPLGAVNWILRANHSPGLADSLRRAVAEIDSSQRVGQIQTMDQIVSSTTADSRFDAWLFAILAALALLLTAIGLYGLLSFSVARRSNEIGTRMALGASRPAVLVLILKQGVALTCLGLALGLGGALLVTRSLTTLLFGVKPTDPVNFLSVSAVLLAVGLLASYFPARRATRVDPMVALRDE